MRVLTLTEAEEAALAGLLQSEAGDDGPLLDLLERLCPTYTQEQQWEAGCYVSDWHGHYSSATALVTAVSDLGWSPSDSEELLTLALWDLSSMGPAPAEGSREWLTARLLEEQATALAQRDGWDLAEDLSQILAEELERAEDWLNAQPQTPEGHYWGHSEYGGWGLWPQEEEL